MAPKIGVTDPWGRANVCLASSQETVRRNPTDREKGTKRHLLVDGSGVPLAVVLTGACHRDVTQVENVMYGIVVTRPESSPENLQHFCDLKAYDSTKPRSAMEERSFIPPVHSRGEEKLEKTTDARKARRWGVEVCLSWIKRFRKLLVSCESYLALICLACAIIAWRKVAPS